MKNILDNKQTEEKQNNKGTPRTVIADKLIKIRELIDRNCNVIKREVEQ